MTLGQEFHAYAAFVKRDLQRLEQLKPYLAQTNLGGTAIGTGVNSSHEFVEKVHARLAELTHLPCNQRLI